MATRKAAMTRIMKRTTRLARMRSDETVDVEDEWLAVLDVSCWAVPLYPAGSDGCFLVFCEKHTHIHMYNLHDRCSTLATTTTSTIHIKMQGGREAVWRLCSRRLNCEHHG